MQSYQLAEADASLEEVLRLLATEQEPTRPAMLARAKGGLHAVTPRKLATGIIVALTLSTLAMHFTQTHRTVAKEAICERECVASSASDFSSWNIDRRGSD